MSIKIRQHLVPAKQRKTLPGTNPKRWITVHETANPAPGATANAHARLQSGGNSRNASWHYQVDDLEIVQSYDDDARCLHAGDGAKGTGNRESIAIEICVNGGLKPAAVTNAISLIAHLMVLHNIPVENVVQHNHWSGKNCPTNLRRDGWAELIAALPQYRVSSNTTTPAPLPEEEGPDMHVIHANGGRYALVSGGRAIKLHAHEYQNYKTVGVVAVKLSDARFDQIIKEWK